MGALTKKVFKLLLSNVHETRCHEQIWPDKFRRFDICWETDTLNKCRMKRKKSKKIIKLKCLQKCLQGHILFLIQYTLGLRRKKLVLPKTLIKTIKYKSNLA